jgi:superfamily I DNA/RNA helicase
MTAFGRTETRKPQNRKKQNEGFFYVAFTRARKRIVMLVASRFANKAAIPSPFINELGLTII